MLHFPKKYEVVLSHVIDEIQPVIILFYYYYFVFTGVCSRGAKSLLLPDFRGKCFSANGSITNNWIMDKLLTMIPHCSVVYL